MSFVLVAVGGAGLFFVIVILRLYFRRDQGGSLVDIQMNIVL